MTGDLRAGLFSFVIKSR